MQTGGLSPFWSILGILIWIIILAMPILIYLAIAELQRARKRRNEPTFTLGERLDRHDMRTDLKARGPKKKRAG